MLASIAGLKVFLSVFLTVNLFYLSGRCARCGENVVGEGTGCTAMDQVFHVDCFTCMHRLQQQAPRPALLRGGEESLL